jgi:ATP-dependent DNA helicase RecG
MLLSSKPEFTSSRQPKSVLDDIRNILVQLAVQSADVVESETLEIKGWCASSQELAEKVSEAVACLANAQGGLVLAGIADHSKEKPKYSQCPFPSVSPEWLQQRIHDLTMPPVACSVFDISDLIVGFAPSGSHALAVTVPKTRFMGGHLTAKGISKTRVGKECRPQYAAEDDRSKVTVPGATRESLSALSIQWAVSQHVKRFGTGLAGGDPWDTLRQVGLILEESRPCNSIEEPISLAALLLFGTSDALKSFVPFFETHIITGVGTKTLRLNIVESVRQLCFGSSALLLSIVPGIDIEILRELVVNAYVHRCYRSPGPVIIRADENGWEIGNPGELAAGLHVGNLIHCVPVYRNLLLAEGARFYGLCDKIGQGIDIAYRGVLKSGLPFPEFESEHGKFSARISLEGSREFQEFLRKRAQSLTKLDEIIVLRMLWSHESVSNSALHVVMQRGREFGERVLAEMAQKAMIEKTLSGNDEYRLSPIVRSDIENIFKNNQLSMRELWGE